MLSIKQSYFVPFCLFIYFLITNVIDVHTGKYKNKRKKKYLKNIHPIISLIFLVFSFPSMHEDLTVLLNYVMFIIFYILTFLRNILWVRT